MLGGISDESAAVILVVVAIDGRPPPIVFHGGLALRHLGIDAFEDADELGVIKFSTHLTHLGHADDHVLEHLRLLRLADFEGIN